MTRAEILALFPNASASLLNLADDNNHTLHPRTNPEPQRPDRQSELALPREAEKEGTARIHLRIVSVRKRLLDPDNLVPKWTIDALRYCGIIPGDEPEKITLETLQRKAAKGEEEHTIVEIITP